jgi:hypothetical protein
MNNLFPHNDFLESAPQGATTTKRSSKSSNLFGISALGHKVRVETPREAKTSSGVGFVGKSALSLAIFVVTSQFLAAPLSTKSTQKTTIKPATNPELLPPVTKTHPQTGLPYVDCPHEDSEDLTPTQVAEILMQQEVDWLK